MKYKPVMMKDGRIQHVPIVVKNKDVLIGYLRAFGDFLEGVGELLDLNNEEILSRITPIMDSSRFNNYIDDGVDASNFTEEQFEEFKKEKLEIVQGNPHPENDKVDLDVGFFSMDCNCGNFVVFKTIKEIPNVNFQCDICDRTLIQYIHVDDEEVEVDGDKE